MINAVLIISINNGKHIEILSVVIRDGRRMLWVWLYLEIRSVKKIWQQ